MTPFDIEAYASMCADIMQSRLREMTGKQWVVIVRNAKFLDFQLLCHLTHWRSMTPFGGPETIDRDLDLWVDYMVSAWKRDMQEMSC